MKLLQAEMVERKGVSEVSREGQMDARERLVKELEDSARRAKQASPFRVRPRKLYVAVQQRAFTHAALQLMGVLAPKHKRKQSACGRQAQRCDCFVKAQHPLPRGSSFVL